MHPVNGTYYQAVEKTSWTRVAIKIDFTVKFSVFLLQISQLVHMGQTEQFCLGMKRHEFQTILPSTVSYHKSIFFKKRKKLLLSDEGWSIWLFGERDGGVGWFDMIPNIFLTLSFAGKCFSFLRPVYTWYFSSGNQLFWTHWTCVNFFLGSDGVWLFCTSMLAGSFLFQNLTNFPQKSNGRPPLRNA